MQADADKINRLLKTARGQIDGILKMIENDRYCIDIANQILAVQSLLGRANTEILKAHMQKCVRQAVQEGRDAEKIDEILLILEKMAK
jgi:DNA-binding FrmR family transcriptional regulator